MKKIKLIYVITVFVLFVNVALSAPPPPPGGGPGCWPPPCVPIDGGIALLIGAGAILGAKKVISKRNAKKNNAKL